MDKPHSEDEVDRAPDRAPSRLSTCKESIRIEVSSDHAESTRRDSEDGEKRHANLQRRATTKPFFLHPTMWMWEIISLVCALAIFLAIVIVLAVYDGKPSPVVGGATLNTVIAIAATVFRILLMVPVTDCICQLTWVWLKTSYRPLQDVLGLDMASRGPLGSLLVLLNFGYGIRASAAAFVIIVGIATAPFFQQTVSFYSSSVPQAISYAHGGTAFASAAFTYMGSIGAVGSDTARIGDYVPANLVAAMYSGMYSSNVVTPPEPPYSCSTGNCTWDPFPTLAMSVQCFDSSSSYSLNCSSKPDNASWPGRTIQPCSIGDPSKGEHANSNYMVYDSYPFWKDVSPAKYLDSFFNDTEFNYRVSGDPNETWTSVNAGYALFQWRLARNLLVYPSDSMSPSIITTDSKIDAGYCVFNPEMQVIQASVQNGIYQETVIGSTTEIEPFDNKKPPILDHVGVSHDIGSTEEGNLTYTYSPACQNSSNPAASCEHKGEAKTIQITVPRQILSNLLAALSHSLPSTNLTSSRQNGVFAGVEASGDAAKSLYRSSNITDTMHTIARYVSVALRANDTTLERQQNPATNKDYVAPSHRVAGTVHVQVVLLHVRWVWLAFPAAMLFFVAVILFDTIRISRPADVGVWKSNLFAVLLNTQWRPETQMMGATTSRDLGMMAQGLEAKIVYGEGASGDCPSVVIRNRSVVEKNKTVLRSMT